LHGASEDSETLYEKIGKLLAQKWDKKISVEKAVGRFLEEYELIFTVNIFAENAFKKLEQALQKDKFLFVEILRHKFEFVGQLNQPKFDDVGLLGNALDVADSNQFKRITHTLSNSENVESWYIKLPQWKRKFFEEKIIAAQHFEQLREFCRWLTVKNINYIRSAILQHTSELIFFSSLSEEVSEDECMLSKKRYQSFDKFNLPVRLSGRFLEKDRTMFGVSIGIAQGKIVGIDGLSQTGKKILFTKMLTPDLVKYFDQIEGILSEQGGMLSHLAILAREKGIPVIVGVDMEKKSVEVGDMVEIDGGSGVFEKIGD